MNIEWIMGVDPIEEKRSCREFSTSGDGDQEGENKGEGKKISTAAKLKWAVGPTLGIVRRTLGR